MTSSSGVACHAGVMGRTLGGAQAGSIRGKPHAAPQRTPMAVGHCRRTVLARAPRTWRQRTVGKIVVGTEDSLRGQDAVALVADIARASGSEVLAVCAYPYDNRASAHYNPVMRAPLREAAEATLADVCEPLSDLAAVHRLAIEDVAPARALLCAAQAAEADLIVVGSSHAGFSGHVVLGSTAARLLDGSPCPVAVAPQGHRLRPHAAHGRVTV